MIGSGTRALGIVFVALGASGISCARCNGERTTTTTTTSASGSSSALASNGGARCTSVGKPARFGEERDDAGALGDESTPTPFGAELGGATADAEGFLVGARQAGLTGESAVLRVDLEGNALTVVSKWSPKSGTAHAPLVDVDPSGRVVIGTLVEDAGRSTLHVDALAADGARSVLGDIDEGSDESDANAIAANAAGALIFWDDADPTHAVGRIRASIVPAHATVAPSTSVPVHPLPKSSASSASPEATPLDVVSPKTSNAAWPIVARSPDGARAVLIWLAERSEAFEDHDGGEGEPSQDEAFRWAEARVIDLANGQPLGAARALTALDGHAQTIAARWTGSGLIVVVRDDPRPTDGDGGVLIAARAAIDGTAIGEPTRATIADDGVAPGVPFLAPYRDAAITAYLALDGKAQLVPTFVAGPRSTEPLLEGRVIVAVRGDRVLSSRAARSGLELTVLRCAP